MSAEVDLGFRVGLAGFRFGRSGECLVKRILNLSSKIALFLVALVMAFTAVPASAITRPPVVKAPVTDGMIYGSSIDKGWLYVGGHFSKITKPNGRVANATNFAAIRLSNYNTIRTYNVNGIIRTVSRSMGITYFGGRFDRVNGVARSNLAAVKSDTGKLTSFKPNAPERVRSLSSYKGQIAVADNGGFRLFNANGSLRWWDRVGGGIGQAVMIRGDSVYIGGTFTSVMHRTRYQIAKVRISDGGLNNRFHARFHPITEYDSNNSPKNGWITLAFASAPNYLLVGIGGKSNRIRAINYKTGDGVWMAQTVGNVQVIAVTRNYIYAGYHTNGRYAEMNEGSKFIGRMITRWHIKNHVKDKTWDLGIAQNYTPDYAHDDNGGIWTMRVHRGRLYIGGSFDRIYDYSNTAWGDGSGRASRSFVVVNGTI